MPPNTQKVALIIGASRGIGRQIALDLARANYAVIISGKSTSTSLPTPFPPDPNSNLSTITTVAREIEIAGGSALAVPCDVRSHSAIEDLIAKSVAWRGRLDVVVYNSGAIWWGSVAGTSVKRFGLMQGVNVEGLYAVVQGVLPVLYRNGGDGKGEGRIVVVSPPIYSRFLRGKTAYAMGKWGMSALTMGLAVDFEREGRRGLAVTSLWPAAAIESAATQANQSDEMRSQLRKPTIFSDAVLAILNAPVEDVNGKCLLDEDFLRDHEGVHDFSKYALIAGTTPRRIMPAKMPDLTVAEQADEGMRMDSTQRKRPQASTSKL